MINLDKILLPREEKIPTIEESLLNRNNNFDFIRFIAASMVLFAHSYPLSGHPDKSPVIGQWHLGGIAVAIFFVISGFLIHQSYENSKSPIQFTKSRVLRIFPGLAFSLILSTFIVGPLVTTLSVKDYFLNTQTYQYLKAIFLYPMQWYLPGVFEHNAYKGVVNGSLWTIPFEFMFYMVIGVLGITGMLRLKKLIFSLFGLTLYLYIANSSLGTEAGFTILGLQFYTILELFTYFSAGMLLYTFRKVIPIDKHIAMLSIVLLYLSIFYGGVKEVFAIFGSYLIIYFSFTPNIKLWSFSKYGDFSYGIYVFAFPVQQAVTYFFGGKMEPVLNFLIAFPITFLMAVISWHLVEKNFLKVKRVSLIPWFFPVINFNLSERTSKLRVSLNLLFEFVVRLGWTKFILLFSLFVVFFLNYNAKPSVVKFPYNESNSIFHGGWQPQNPEEKYRWISGSASIDLNQSINASKLIIRGYVPEGFSGLTKMRVFLNNQFLKEVGLKSSKEIIFISDIPKNEGPAEKIINIRMDFDYVHKPKASDLDKRELSALLTEIVIE